MHQGDDDMKNKMCSSPKMVLISLVKQEAGSKKTMLFLKFDDTERAMRACVLIK